MRENSGKRLGGRLTALCKYRSIAAACLLSSFVPFGNKRLMGAGMPVISNAAGARVIRLCRPTKVVHMSVLFLFYWGATSRTSQALRHFSGHARNSDGN